MRPLGMILALTFGSAVCFTAGLVMSLAVLLLAEPTYPEVPVLARVAPWGLLLTSAAGLALLGELRERPWRRQAQGALVVVVVVMAAWFVPPGAFG